MSVPIYKMVIDAYEKKGLQSVFRDVLGWDATNNESEIFKLSNFEVRGDKIASMFKGVGVFRFSFPESQSVSPKIQNEISKVVGLKYAERLLIIQTRTSTTWLWPKRTSGGALTHEKIITNNASMPIFLAQRLAALRFTAADMLQGISLMDLRDKLRGSFDTSTVTKRFFDRFKTQHEVLAKSIEGLESEQAGSYATLLLNRLMFLYFLQKKEFLNGDPHYLQNCLREVRALDSGTTFYNFYRDLLLVLFFDVLNDSEQVCRNPAIAKIIGKVPYVNGGIFGKNDLEKHESIAIPDEAFESIFTFFDSFTWHLDTRPTGKADEINPEVIGYIFEQYINFTAGGKKLNGAYYTKSDVTGYMASQTLVPRLLDTLITGGLDPLILLPTSGVKYMNQSLLHGWSEIENGWAQVTDQAANAWSESPSSWSILDNLDTDDVVCLPGESWVEMFHRREAVDALRDAVARGEIGSVNDLITTNLNSHLLLLDAISAIDSGDDLQATWLALEKISVIDPTCGSGAFLFGALEILETVYGALIDVAEELQNTSAFAKDLIENLTKHPNRRYFIRKKAALNNLYGTDLMVDAVETAKLRVFLALASCLDKTDDIEPLPDLDFNIKVGNLLVGIKDIDDMSRIASGDLTARLALDGLAQPLEEYVACYEEFVSGSENNHGPSQDAKSQLLEKNAAIVARCDHALADMTFVADEDFEHWKDSIKPFHWFAEFPQVFKQGGFDVILGNPPYIKARDYSAAEKRNLVGYETLPFRDLYEVCYERSLDLLAADGRHAFIVMSSIARGDDFSTLRQLISATNRSEWWSTYSIRPASLFTGIKVRNAILVLGPKGNRVVHSTRNNVFTTQTRTWLFDGLEYSKINRIAFEPPLRGGLANGLALDLFALDKGEGKRTDTELYMRNSGKYWYPVLLGSSLIFNDQLHSIGADNVAKTAKLFEFERLNNAISLCAGKLGFFSWALLGDDFNVAESQTLDLRKTLFDPDLNDKLSKAALDVVEAGKNCVILSEYRGTLYPNVNWPAVRDTTDHFDYLYLQNLGLEHHWKNLNIWYRQVMKITREDNQRVRLSREQVSTLLNWV